MSRVLLFSLFVLLSMNSHGRELILSFHSDITLKQSGQIKVTETIQVKSEGINIRRGIYRDFPTQYMGSWLTKKEVGFTVYSVMRDGQPEPFKLDRLRNGFRVYIGAADVYLQPGVYTYELTYFTNRQLGYHDHHDEFYWNVTGNGWDFEIIKASTAIHLPNNAIDVVYDQQGWTGYQGEQQQNFRLSQKDQAVVYQTTEPLLANQGLTVGLSFPKGVFAPEPFDLAAFLSANLPWILTALVAFLYALFCGIAWWRFGKDPEPGVIVAHYRPPQHLSPALVHFISNEDVDDRTLTTAILSLAVKEHIHIKQAKKSYRITKKQSKAALTKGEKITRDQLFKNSNKITIGKQYNARLSAAKRKLTDWLHKEFQHSCFKDNGFYVVWAWVISTLAFFLGSYLMYSHMLSPSDFFFVCFGTVMFLVFLLTFLVSWPILSAMVILGLMALSYADLFTWLVANLPWVIFTLSLVALNLLFSYLMRSPTLYGRHLIDKIEGLRLYMKAAEEHRLNLMNPPSMDKDHFESLFPYALALNLENRWAEQFANLFNTEKPTAGDQSHYQPSWFDSHQHKQFSDLSLSSATRAMGRSLAAAAVRPTPSSSGSSSSYSSSSRYSSSSSSYSSSGGSSGGGGGGGGGGGW